ncbi:MAG TPA: primosomal protein N' [Ignavibacteria bacterium]|nr:primosomal protein N' [Ignavibacteria bacterium]HRF64774.1 primosomal protein N' [Ignavibacteria bacterium]HRJ05569.1 primosomal protein N' [Ignavibacteria bacterium]
MQEKFANIAFNIPVSSLFTYSIPDELKPEVSPGIRVLAPFGNKDITGIVVSMSDNTDLTKLKDIKRILDPVPVLSGEMIGFCKWISAYYISPIGEVIFAAVPKGVNVESKVLYSAAESTPNINYTQLQKNIISLLEEKTLTIKQIENKLRSKSVRSAVHSLTAAGALEQAFVTTNESAKPKFERYVKFDLLEEFREYNKASLEIFFKENKFRSSCQVKVLKYLIQNEISEAKASDVLKTTRSALSVLKSLEKREFLTLVQKQVNRAGSHEFSDDKKIIELNSDQKNVLKEINSSLGIFKTFLLFGVTGSGKTQVYIEAIQNVLNNGKTAIVLVPEISLTPQLIHRFKTYFGDIIGVIHSKLSDGQRFDVYQRIRSGEIKIVIGARSALFAPLSGLGIIIVDEEHDHSYKQTEKNPKYNARDSAIMRAKLNNAVVVLGSATPSMESFYNYKAGKYSLIELPHRALKTRQPKVEIVNMLDELRNPSKYKKYETQEQRVLSSRLISYIDSALKKKQAVILMQNRRGYSAYQQCLDCGTVKMCRNCDITMIYHKHKNNLRCHYCGSVESLLTNCEICGSNNLKLIGVGTEKIEEEIQRLFPEARSMRMDADTVKGKDAHRKILKSFHEGEFDILIGTQMISKGLDFPNVYLVGVISADIGLFIPDFRASEKTFQLLMQVSGRSGRISDDGRVVIQTMNPENYIFPLVENHDYTGFFEKEIKHRQLHRYPPYSKMILIEVSSPNQVSVNNHSWKIYHHLNNKLVHWGSEIHIELLKPAPALIYKIKNTFRMHIILKVMKTTGDTISQSEALVNGLHEFTASLKLKSTERVNIDVDPLSFY